MKCFLPILLLMVVPSESMAQVERAQVIIAYVNNFARYTTWPDEDRTDSFRIALVTDNIDITREFREFVLKRKIKDKPISLTIQTSLPLPHNVNIILLTQEESAYLLEIYDDIEGKPILLISEEYKDKRNIMINLYESPEERLLFEVNRANIINQKLVIDPEILLAGGTEVDVASLYRKSQLSLRNMQKNMDIMNDSVEDLHKNIRFSRGRINNQQLEILKQKELLTERSEKLDSHQKVIISQLFILSSQKDSIDSKNSVLQNKIHEATVAEQIIKTRQQQINDLNLKIEDKNLVLNNQSIVILRQRYMLKLSLVIALMTAIIVITVFVGYRNNKLKSNILTRQKSEIEEKLGELRKMNIQLQNSDQYKSIFLASMSHELRTPLNSIIGYTGILLMGMAGGLNEEQVKQLNKVKNNAKHLLSLINDILDISKIEADRVELHFDTFSLKKLVDEAIETIHPRIVEKHLEIISEIPEDLIISTDTRRLKQVVLNLVSNAVNYTDSGFIYVHARRLPENKFILSVKDSGIGIPENEISRLFQPFQQIDSSLTKKNKGTGLGLYLCKKLMTLLRGEIFVKSEFGKGSIFYIEMPVDNH
jgi:signal transduction histidine kinase